MSTLNEKINFTVLIDKMKKIDRRTKIIGVDRRETDAEHSFSIALMAYVFRDYAKDVNLEKTMLMLLVHDLVEIYAGDTFAYDVEGNKTKKDREEQASIKVFSELGEDGEYLRALWHEFDAIETPEAKFANAMDRAQPIINNIYNDGGTWNEFHVKWSQLMKRMRPIKEFNSEIFEYLVENAKPYFSRNGMLIDDNDEMFFIGDEKNPIAKLVYKEDADSFSILEVFVEESHRNQGIAKELVLEAKSYADFHKKEIIPICPYAKKVLETK